MANRSHRQLPRQRATAWLCLAVAVLVALLPAVGVKVCMGHDGHVGMSGGLQENACPCDHGATPVGREVTAPDRTGDRHPPCDDVALDPPEFYKGGDSTRRARQALQAPAVDAPQVEQVGCSAVQPRRVGPPRLAPAGALRPPEQLAHRRVVVLLI